MGLLRASEIQESATHTLRISFAKGAFAFQINQVITTITGIGDVLGGIIVGDIGDISHFESAPQLFSYANLLSLS